MNSYYGYDDSSYELKHYGTPRHSGRYPYGSGERPFQGDPKREAKAYKADKKIRYALESSEITATDVLTKKIKDYRDTENQIKSIFSKYNIDANPKDFRKKILDNKISKNDSKKAVSLINKASKLEAELARQYDESMFFANKLNKQVDQMIKKYGKEKVKNIDRRSEKITDRDVIKSLNKRSIERVSNSLPAYQVQKIANDLAKVQNPFLYFKAFDPDKGYLNKFYYLENVAENKEHINFNNIYSKPYYEYPIISIKNGNIVIEKKNIKGPM